MKRNLLITLSLILITVFPILNLNPTLQKQFGKHWSVSVSLENMLQQIGRAHV